MENSFLETLKKRLLQDSVFITYKVGENVTYKKYFLKAANQNFYNSKYSYFQLICGITNKLEVIKASDVIQFESIDEETDEKGKFNFNAEINKSKLDYEKYSLIAKSLSIDGFDNLFFREDYTPLHKQLILVFGKKIPVENLIKDFKGEIKLNKEELDFCKNVWMKVHGERHMEIMKIIDGEIKDSESSKDVDMFEELTLIKEEYNNCLGECVEKVNSFESLKELSDYWHPLLLPAPEIYRF